MEQLLPDSIRKKIADKLNELGISTKCPMCGDGEFLIVDGYVIPVLQNGVKNLKLSGISLPTAAATCNRCGYIIQFALGAFGLMEEKEKENVKSE